MNRPVRVLHIGKFFPPHRGGIESHLQTLVCGLREFVDLHVVVANDGATTEARVVDGVPVTSAGTRFQFASAPVCPAMFRLMRESKADLIHVHLPNPAAVLCYLASRPRARLVVSYHADTVRHPFLAKAFQPLLLYFLSRSAAIIVASNRSLESSLILDQFKERSRVIPYGIPAGEFQDPDLAGVQSIRERYGPRIVLAVGRLVYYKGLPYLIRAMKSVDARLLIVGDGPLRGQLEREVEECGIRHRVSILGAIEDLRPYYHACDLFVLPSISRAEGFGIVQLEAMACGKPVVNTQLPTGVPDVSLHAVTGLTVPPANPEALAEAINLLFDNPDLRHKYGQAARLRLEREFTAELMTQRMLELYKEVAGLPSNDVWPEPSGDMCGGPAPVLEPCTERGFPMFAMKAAKAPDVMIRQVNDESVVLDLNTERYLGLDDVATRMWQALVESPSVEHAYEELRDVYAVDPATLRKDLEDLVNKLMEYGLLRLQDQ